MVRVRVTWCYDGTTDADMATAATMGARAFVKDNGADGATDVRDALRQARMGIIGNGGMLLGGGAAPAYRLAAWRVSRNG